MTFWQMIYRFSWITVGIFVCIAIPLMFLPQYNQFQENQRREQELVEKIRQKNRELKTLKAKRERFQSDPRFVEKIAHEIGLAKPEETIFKFIDEQDPLPNH